MAEKYLPLPDLEIDDMSKKLSDQQTVDNALVVYKESPDFFERFAERDKADSEVVDIADELRVFVRERLGIVDSLVQATILHEIRRRARRMYGLKFPQRGRAVV